MRVLLLGRRLSNHVLTAPDAAGLDGAAVAPVVPICVPPSGSVGRDPTDGADLEGAAPAHGVTAMTGSRIAGSARHSTTGTTTGGRLELATPHGFGQPYNRVGPSCMAGGQVSAAPIWRASGGLVGGPALAAENELAGSISIAPEGKTDLPRKPGHIRF